MRIFVVVIAVALFEHTFRVESKKLDDGLHLGDSRRLENVLQKALRGETLHMAIIGGSNSAGGGIEKDETTLDGLYYNVFSNWWNHNIGKKTGAILRRHKMAIGAMGGYFFAFCYKTFISGPDKALDIVLVEQSVNFNTIGKAEPLEQLTRQLLAHPSNPAIIFINLFSGMGTNPSTGQINNLRCTNLEDYGQIEIERHYNITSISLRDIICPVTKSGNRQLKENDMFATDELRHVGMKGHALVARTLISYAQNAFISGLKVGRPEVSRQIPTVPPPIFVKILLAVPLCWTHATPDISRDFHSSLAVDVQRNNGFWLRVKKVSDSTLRTDAQGGWVAKDVGSSVVFRVFVPSPDLRSVILLIHTYSSHGEAQAWLDDNIDLKVQIDNKLSLGQNELYTVFARVTPGHHYVTVQLTGPGDFMVSGLFVGPPYLDIKRFL